ncbi:MAG: glycosyltransferase [Candidatus Cloacimonadota bacterium]|nr:MAG: glycosyltransferase [Candidatus Cloacimonadota bacterium]
MNKLLKTIPEGSSYCFYKSPFQKILLVACNKYLRALIFEKSFDFRDIAQYTSINENKSHSILSETCKQLEQFFTNKRKNFDIPLYLEGTDFQKSSWGVLKTIPYGKTISYQEQAKQLGDIKKCRAVGAANGKNPIAIIVPCHRVIAKSGALQGFGGGLDFKKYLLNLEKR